MEYPILLFDGEDLIKFELKQGLEYILPLFFILECF